MRLRRANYLPRIATLPASGPTPNPHKHRDLPPAFLARMHPRRALDPRALEAACRDGLSTRKMAAMFRCHCSHVVRELRRNNLCTVAAALHHRRDDAAGAQAPAAPIVAAQQLCNNELHTTASLQSRRRGAQHAHPGVEAGRSSDATTLLSFEEPAAIAMSVPDHLQRDIAMLRRRPKLSLHRRGPAARRLAKWWCGERDWMIAERAVRVCETALRANHQMGVSYRLARRIQDQIYGERMVRSATWSACKSYR